MDNNYSNAIKNWKLKAHLQNIIAMLPDKISYPFYFWIQRYFGNLKMPVNPINHFVAGVNILERIKKNNLDINNKVFFEVGTGRVPILPITFWLAGAEKVITVDLNPFMRLELIKDMLFYIRTETEQIKNIFGNMLIEERFEKLLNIANKNKITQNDFLDLFNIKYFAPQDASKMNLPDNSIDYHISHTVYEHIPLDILYNILKEGNRIVKNNGLFVNLIDYSDHFANMDASISRINFLQYNDKKWAKYADNKYMYMNRARHNEYVALFEKIGHTFVEIEPYVNEKVKMMLENKQIDLDAKFKKLNIEILSIVNCMFVTKKNKNDVA